MVEQGFGSAMLVGFGVELSSLRRRLVPGDAQAARLRLEL